MANESEDLQAQIAGALRKCARTQAQIARAALTPAPGDLYAFSITAAEGIEGAGILRHRDDDALWFLIPYDQSPLVGTWDVATSPDSEAGPGVPRCGYGIWAYADDLRIGERSGFLRAEDVWQARLRLAAMVGGDEKLIATCSEATRSEATRSEAMRSAVDDDPDYE